MKCLLQASGVKDRLGVELVGEGVTKTKSRVHVHRIVFASVSNFLTTLLSEVEESLVTILLPGASQVELEALVQLVYTGRCKVGGESGRRKLYELATSLGISRSTLVEEEGSGDMINTHVRKEGEGSRHMINALVEKEKKEEVLDNSTLTIDGGLGQRGIVSPSGTQENHTESSSRKDFSNEEYDLVESNNRYRLMEFQGRKHLIDNVVSKNNCKRSKKNESVLKKNTKQFSEATHDLSLNDIDDGFTSIRYACHICSKSLSRKNDLKRHVMFTPESANFPAPFAQLDLCPRAILTSM